MLSVDALSALRSGGGRMTLQRCSDAATGCVITQSGDVVSDCTGRVLAKVSDDGDGTKTAWELENTASRRYNEKAGIYGEPTELGHSGIHVPQGQFGRKVGKHAYDFGLNPAIEADREAFLRIINSILDAPDEIVHGRWRGQDESVVLFIKGEDVVITSNSGQFISILKGGINNARIKDARK